MTMYEKLLRVLLGNILIPLASILLSSLWFALSILAHVIGFFLPTNRPLSSLPQPRRSNGTTARPSASSAAVAPLPSILSSRKDSPHHHVKFPDETSTPVRKRRAGKRWSLPAGLEGSPRLTSSELPAAVAPPVAESEPQSDAKSPCPNPILSISKHLQHLSHLDTAPPTASPVSSTHDDEQEFSLSRSSSVSEARRSSLTRKLPAMNPFRTRNKKRKSEDGHSRSSSFSSSVASSPPNTPPVLVLELKQDPEKGSTSTASSADRPSRSGFAQAFKFRAKRASASATMSASADKSSALLSEALRAFEQQQQTPSPPPSPDRVDGTPTTTRSRSQTRRKAFASYLSLSVQHHHTPSSPSERPATSPAPVPQTAATEDGFLPSSAQRSAFSPSTPKSRCARRHGHVKTPSQPAPRTQPYGFPYYAMMPNGEYAEASPTTITTTTATATATAVVADVSVSTRRRSSLGGAISYSNSKSSSVGDMEKEEIEHVGTLGLEFGQLNTPRPTRYQQPATVS